MVNIYDSISCWVDFPAALLLHPWFWFQHANNSQRKICWINHMIVIWPHMLPMSIDICYGDSHRPSRRICHFHTIYWYSLVMILWTTCAGVNIDTSRGGREGVKNQYHISDKKWRDDLQRENACWKIGQFCSGVSASNCNFFRPHAKLNIQFCNSTTFR